MSVAAGGSPSGGSGRPGLATALAARARCALELGALEPIETECDAIEEAGVRFLVRRVSGLARKEEVRRREAQGSAPRDPFASPDPRLVVAELSPTHVALLNKFPVLEHHLLVVTRVYADQETLLAEADFAALVSCLAAIDGLAFYNAGAAAGASQMHKHLQLVPLPLAPVGPALPIEPWLATASARVGAIGELAPLPGANAFTRLDPAWLGGPEASRRLHALYGSLLRAAGIGMDGARTTRPYNLLATRGWMLVISRSRGAFAGISINALGFAGSFFVRDEAQAARLREVGPIEVLRRIAAERR